VYGLNRGETPKFSVLVVPQPGRYPVRDSRNAQRAAGVDIVTTEWDEPPVIGNAIEPRSINLSLSTLSRGRYTLSVAVTLPGQQTVESVRTIEIVR
jgi:hypothetical protein